MPPPAGDPLAVKQSAPMSFHMGPSGYASNRQSTLAAIPMTPNRVRFSATTPSESVASSDSWRKVDFVNSPKIKTERDLEMDVE
eukprot:9353873-Karenia_brevis.AAC.1